MTFIERCNLPGLFLFLCFCHLAFGQNSSSKFPPFTPRTHVSSNVVVRRRVCIPPEVTVTLVALGLLFIRNSPLVQNGLCHGAYIVGQISEWY